MPAVLGLTTTVVAWILLAVVVVGWLVYIVLHSTAFRREVGSELELAPNRRPYFDDETLEGRRLERVQLYGLLLLVVITIGLPLYWVLEPDRQAGAPGRPPEPTRRLGGRPLRDDGATAGSTAPGATAG